MSNTIVGGQVSLEVAMEAVTEVTPTLTRLLRSVRDPAPHAVGSWNVGQAAAHMAHVVDLDLEAARGNGAESSIVAKGVKPPPRVSELHHMTAALLDHDPVRDPAAQADAIEKGIAELLAVCEQQGEGRVPWLLGATLPRSAVCSHQVLEMLVHGWDIARGTGADWTIPSDLASVAIEGFIIAIICELGTSDPDYEARATCEIRLRGGGRFVLALTEAGPTVRRPDGRVDLHLSADPAAMLLSILGRSGSRLSRLLSGDILAWGPHPKRGLSVFGAIKAP